MTHEPCLLWHVFVGKLKSHTSFFSISTIHSHHNVHRAGANIGTDNKKVNSVVMSTDDRQQKPSETECRLGAARFSRQVETVPTERLDNGIVTETPTCFEREARLLQIGRLWSRFVVSTGIQLISVTSSETKVLTSRVNADEKE